MSGNDFHRGRLQSDTALVQAVSRGIKEADSKHLQTVELNFTVSSSLDDSSWRSLIKLDAVYTYLPTYAELLKEYQSVGFYADVHDRGEL